MGGFSAHEIRSNRNSNEAFLALGINKRYKSGSWLVGSGCWCVNALATASPLAPPCPVLPRETRERPRVAASCGHSATSFGPAESHNASQTLGEVPPAPPVAQEGEGGPAPAGFSCCLPGLGSPKDEVQQISRLGREKPRRPRLWLPWGLLARGWMGGKHAPVHPCCQEVGDLGGGQRGCEPPPKRSLNPSELTVPETSSSGASLGSDGL